MELLFQLYSAFLDLSQKGLSDLFESLHFADNRMLSRKLMNFLYSQRKVLLIVVNLNIFSVDCKSR